MHDIDQIQLFLGAVDALTTKKACIYQNHGGWRYRKDCYKLSAESVGPNCRLFFSFVSPDFFTYKDLMYLILNLRPCDTHG